MSDEDITYSMPVLVMPVKRELRPMTLAIGLITFLALVLAAITSLILKTFQKRITEAASAAKESEMGSLASIVNLIYLLLIVVIVTILLILAIKKGLYVAIKYVMTGLMVYLVIAFAPYMLWLYGVFIWLMFKNNGIVLDPRIYGFVLLVLSYVLTIIFAVVYVISIVKKRYYMARNVVLIFISVWAAVWMSWNMGELTPIVILIGFALYDLYSVFRGPLRNLAEYLTEQRESSESEDKGFVLGLGDIFFYSFAVGYSFAFLNFIEVLIVMFALVGGLLITVAILFKFEFEALPALPISIFLAVPLIIIFKYLI